MLKPRQIKGCTFSASNAIRCLDIQRHSHCVCSTFHAPSTLSHSLNGIRNRAFSIMVILGGTMSVQVSRYCPTPLNSPFTGSIHGPNQSRQRLRHYVVRLIWNRQVVVIGRPHLKMKWPRKPRKSTSKKRISVHYGRTTDAIPTDTREMTCCGH